MKEMTLEEFRVAQNDFYDKYDDYISIRSVIWNSYLSEKRQEEVIKTLKEAFKGYTDPLERDEFTEINEDYINIFIRNSEKDYYFNLLKHLGKSCEIEGKKGIFKRMIATFEDNYYEIDYNGRLSWETMVSRINFL